MLRALRFTWGALAFVCVAIITGGEARAALDSLYSGKTVTIVVGSAPGGGYDAAARLMSRYLGRHIPGDPKVIVQNEPGAGGLVAANNFYNSAPRDGTALALLQRTALTAKAFIGKNVKFDASKLNWLGSLAGEPGVLLASRNAAVKTTQDLFTTPLVVGGAGIADDSEMTPKVLNAVIGTHLKIISGYKSITSVVLAMERGEVQGVVDLSLSNVERNPSYVSKSGARILMQLGLKRDPKIADIPTPLDMAKNDQSRKILTLYFAPKAVARPVALPPGVPADRVAILRNAFMQMTRDPDFLAEARKIGVLVKPEDHEGVEAVISLINNAPNGEVKRLRAIIGER